ncbi:MAG: methyltransferase domain-containing protein [Candidatus Shapirobacteria bacterium]|jgi:ubiquinone/menaquinone biosynthesis C-methylase UbiE
MNKDTSWQKVGKWYSELVSESGHYYHQHVILPNLLRLMDLKTNDRVIDLACGQGILGRYLPVGPKYIGLDAAKNLIQEAVKLDKNINHKYFVEDVSKEIKLNSFFSHVAIILALQNIKHAFRVVRNASRLLEKDGRFFIVLNHPAFRIPQHSGWGVDKERGIQYRKIEAYMSPLEIPIESSPFDKKNNQLTYTFHYPLSAYCEMLSDNGFVIEKIEEWISDKKSEGGMAKTEDKARMEIPLFMAIVARIIK